MPLEFFVECPTGVRLECTVLNEGKLSLSGSGCLCVSTWSSFGLLSSIATVFSLLNIRYLGGFVNSATSSHCHLWLSFIFLALYGFLLTHLLEFRLRNLDQDSLFDGVLE